MLSIYSYFSDSENLKHSHNYKNGVNFRSMTTQVFLIRKNRTCLFFVELNTNKMNRKETKIRARVHYKSPVVAN